jgi:uncharacterized membrane protein
MKLYTKKEILPIILILAIFAIGLYFWPFLPERVPTHWNIQGQIDGWSSKNFAVFFFPMLIAGLYLLLSFIPLMDPLKTNIELFGHLYFWFKVVFVLFMGMLYGVTIYAGLGNQVNVGLAVMLGIAVLFLFIGLMMPKIKKNYTIGIRLPWTLHSEAVWDKTHQFGGKLFIALAILMVIIAFLPGPWAFGILIGGIILMLVVLIWYSYHEWRVIEGEKKF